MRERSLPANGTVLPVVGIIGCGHMGSALAATFADGGFTTRLASKHGETSARLAARLPRASAASVHGAAAGSDLIVLAAPVEATCAQIAARIRPHLRDRVVIDVSNPGFAARSGATRHGTPATSAAEQIATALGTPYLVKALNCVAARALECRRPEMTVTVPIAGDDPGAKDTVRWVLELLRFEVADAGPLCNSKWLEGLSEILACVAREGNADDRIGFRLVRFPAPSQEASRRLHDRKSR